MLNNQNERELCYAVRVTDITLSFKAVSNKFLEKYHG